MEKRNFLHFLKSFLKESVLESVTGDTGVQLNVIYVNGRKVLNTPHANYSFGHLHRIFLMAFNKLNFRKKNFNDVLILGFGAGSVLSILRNDFDMDFRVIGVEIDKKVIELAKKHFQIDSYDKLTLINEDAYSFMLHNKKEFDLIVFDVYLDDRMPEKFETEEFLRSLGSSVRKNGMILFNKFVVDQKSEEAALELVQKFEQLLGRTEVIKLKEKRENWILVYENK
jgi:spermidine synthase